MNRINRSQLFCILFLSGMWMLTGIQSLHLPGLLLSFGIQVLLCLPMLMEQDFTTLANRHKWLGILYAGYFLLVGAQGFLQIRDTALPQLHAAPVVSAVLIVLTCLYTSTAGLRSTARCAVPALALLLLSAAVLLTGAWKRADVSRLQFRTEDMWENALPGFLLGTDLPCAWVLLGRVKKNGSRSVLYYVLAKGAAAAGLAVLCRMTCGRLAQDHPFLTLTALSQPLQGQRADALYLLVFVMLHVFHITLLTGVTAHVLGLVHPKLEKSAPFALLAMLLAASLLPDAGTIAALLMPVMACVIPLGIRAARSVQRRAEA